MSLNAKDETPKSEKDKRGSLKIPPDLKQELRVAALNHGFSEYKLVREMWNLWKAQKGPRDEGILAIHSQIGPLTPEEIELCRAVIDFWRSPKDDPSGIGVGVFNTLIKRYRSRGS